MVNMKLTTKGLLQWFAINEGSIVNLAAIKAKPREGLKSVSGI